MRDYNFFEPYVDRGKKSSTSTSNTNYPLLIGLLVVLLVALPVYNLVQSMLMDRQIEALETSVLNDPDYPLLAEADMMRAGIEDGKVRLETLKKMDTVLTSMEWLDEPFLFSLMSTVPKDLEIKNMAIQQGQQIQISGSATNKPAIAELEYNLRNTERFTNLLVRSINNTETGFYDFMMTLQVKGAGEDAVN
jgi:hypothetical protein